MTQTSCAPTVLAFLDAVHDLGVAGSHIAQGPVLVEVDLPCNGAQPPRVSCDVEVDLSAHATIALTQATGALQEASNALQTWVGEHAPIAADNGLVLRCTAGVFQGEDRVAQILQLTSTTGRLSSVRGKRAEFEPPFVALLNVFARMQGGARVFQHYDSMETSHPIKAGDPASAMAYHALVFEGPKRWATGNWCEVFHGAPYTDDVARLLEGRHG
jgi:hypothetical protein